VVICEHGLLLKDIDGNVHAPSCGCQDDKPAGLSTAASAGEAIVQEIADKLCDDVENYVAMEQATRDAGEGLECERVTDECHAKIHGALHTAYAAGIARGRELGARDSIEDVGKVIADNGCDCEGDDCPTSEATCEELGHEPCLAHRVERAIAARRAGRTT
jgi:hypothetical protein